MAIAVDDEARRRGAQATARQGRSTVGSVVGAVSDLRDHALVSVYMYTVLVRGVLEALEDNPL